MINPLLSQEALPRFSAILPEHIEPALKEVLQQNRATLKKLLKTGPSFTWESLMAPLETMGDTLSKLWAPVSHLHAVAENEALRDAYTRSLALLTEYHTEFLQNEELYHAIQAITARPDYQQLDPTQRKIIENDLRDFKLSGVGLPLAEKTRFAELQKELSVATTTFSEHILDATHAWEYHVTDPTQLKGLSEQTISLLKENAAQHGKEGWVITLDQPCYVSVMKYLENRDLRRTLYEAYVTRASDQGPTKQFDNSPVMKTILKIRHELATLLGFKNYAEYSLASNKMSESPQQVLDFLHDLVTRAKKFAVAEKNELDQFAKKVDDIDSLQAWDMSYYSEKLQHTQFSLQEEELRPYFPIQQVLHGLFSIVDQLYGIQVIERKDVDTWHPQVQFFDIFDEQHQLLGSLYTDLYARPHKRDGAWMDECRVRRRLADDSIQTPVAFLTCNFNRPLNDQPALLTHDDVLTVFHEFGHCLHHLLTKIDYAGASGINGVLWDAVELPSQFMENWCWEKDSLALISKHVQTGLPLSDALFNKLLATKHFQTGLFLIRQLEFSLFDFRLHLEYDASQKDQIQHLLNEIRHAISVIPVPVFNRFQHSFSHIFSGGYAAGYYSYLWAEVLSSDAFARFEETGIFNPTTGRAFLKNILEQGGSKHPMDLFIAFRGRKPTIDALLEHRGLVGGL